MIWALLAAYFLGGGLGAVHGGMLTSAAVEDLGVHSQAVISDSHRAQAAQETLKDLRKIVHKFEREFARTGRKLNRYYKSHESNASQALTTLHQLNQEWETVQRQAIDLRFQLRDQMTEEEWRMLFPGA